jgi:hypothetical protein
VAWRIHPALGMAAAIGPPHPGGGREAASFFLPCRSWTNFRLWRLRWFIVEVWQARKKQREVYLTPVERWIISSTGAVVSSQLSQLWLSGPGRSHSSNGERPEPPSMAYKWGEAVGTSREQLLQDERDSREGRPQANLLRASSRLSGSSTRT